MRLACALALWDLHDPRGEPALQQLANGVGTSHLAIPHRELGVAKARRKDFAGARKELDQAVALSPYSTDALVELAEIDAELRDFAAARARVYQALAREPPAARALGLRDKLPAEGEVPDGGTVPVPGRHAVNFSASRIAGVNLHTADSSSRVPPAARLGHLLPSATPHHVT